MKMTKKPLIVRQGDVLLVRNDDLGIAGRKRIPREEGRVVLAHGELTGHAHAIASKHAALYKADASTPPLNATSEAAAQQMIGILNARRAVVLAHEEHAPIRLPAGRYHVIRQREYSPEELRLVAD